MGYPTNEIDARWEALYECKCARFTPLGMDDSLTRKRIPVGISAIPPSEATMLANKTIPRPGTDEHLVELDVFHQLHCLNDLRKALYPDRWPGKWHRTPSGAIDYQHVDFLHWGNPSLGA
jgi:hypothetical protein